MAGLRGRIDALFVDVPDPAASDWTAWLATADAVKADINALFALVTPASHWKDPINAVVPADTDLGDLVAAIEFTTATRPSFTPVDNGWHVTALGYRAGPAGDH